jgi:photosystem II stability/assembly factor-like uncharacterized protein
MRRLLALTLVIATGTGASAGAAGRPVSVQSLLMLDPAHGYALGGLYPAYRLLRTSDGGGTWRDITPDGGRMRPAAAPTVVGGVLLIVTQPHAHTFVVLRSGDGGRTWQRSRPVRFAHGLGPWPIAGPDARHLFLALDEGAAAGSQGEALFASADGGRSWHLRTSTSVATVVPRGLPFGCDKNGVGFATAARGWAGGDCAGGRPFFYRTDDGGRTWRLQRLIGLGNCQCDVSAPTFFTPRDGVVTVVGAFETTQFEPVARVYWTRDGGLHWRGSRAPWGRAGLAAAVAAPGVAWVATTRRGTIRAPFNRLYRTADAGRSWQSTTLSFDAQYYRFDVVDATHAFAYKAASAATTILRTNDGGRTWRRIHTAVAHSTN